MEVEERLPPKLRKGWIRKSFGTLRDVYQRDAGDALTVSHNEAGAAGERDDARMDVDEVVFAGASSVDDCEVNLIVPKHISLINGQRVKVGRQTNAKTVPAERNGYFDSKVLSRQHAEVWEEAAKIFIKDVKSTFINGERLSPEGVESERFELKSDNIVVLPLGVTLHRLFVQADTKACTLPSPHPRALTRSQTHDILIGPELPAGHLTQKYTNTIIGRYANRVPAGTHPVSRAGVQSSLTAASNESPSISLHGGLSGWDLAPWDPLPDLSAATLFSPDEQQTIAATLPH
ncbi:hypothetical protein IEO21_10187 [Rhodonia placenta]|uniref:FHA domain-containing protein n=1 Tax=Rhodonia placenta TaxID=104341 RepID=A0A8H7NSZ2_9APHY|nr:hypothetical protein IEO21_10187 [Postia placenta]